MPYFAFDLKNRMILGTTVESEDVAESRLRELGHIKRHGFRTFVSYEPALSDVGWERHSTSGLPMDWLICGGESGPDARPMHPDWARRARDFCHTHNVPFFFKQWGEWIPHRGHREFMDLPAGDRGWARPFSDEVTMIRVGKKAAGRLLDGKLHDAVPAIGGIA